LFFLLFYFAYTLSTATLPGGSGGGQQGADLGFLEAAFMDDSSVYSTESQSLFKESLIARYSNDLQKDESGRAEILTCMVTGCALPRHQCIAGHLLAKKRIEMGYKFKFDDIFDVKNGILWAPKIEAAYGMKKVCLIYNFIHNQLHFKVLDPSIMGTIIYNGVTFKDVNGKRLDIASQDLPYKRLIWGQSSVAIKHAFEKKWINEIDKDIYQKTLVIIGQHLKLFQSDSISNSDEAIEHFKQNSNSSTDPPMRHLIDQLVSATPFSNQIRNEAAESMSAEDLPSEVQKKCSKCCKFKVKSCFSTRQWKKPTKDLTSIFCNDCNPIKPQIVA